MTDTPVLDKPVYKTGASVASILAANDVAANTPQVVTPTPDTPPATVVPEAVVTPEVVTPEVVTHEPENNLSVINFGDFEEKPATPETPSVAATPSTVPSVNWREEVKNNREDALRELGIEPFALELSEHLKNGGDATDYINAKYIDYNKVTDENIVKADLQKQFPTFSPEQINLMFNRKYTVPEGSEQEDIDFASLQLKADAHNSRQAKIAEQQKFKIPAPIQQKDTSEQSQIEAEKEREEGRRWFSEHEATKSLMTTKRVSLSLGENGTFNFEVSQPEFVTRAITDNTLWQKLTATKTGEPDVSKLQKLVIYAANPEKFENDLVNYGKTLAKPEVLDEARNITPPHKVIPMKPENSGKPQGYKTGRVNG